MSAASDRTLRGEIRSAAVRAFTDPLRLRLLLARGPRDARALVTFLGSIVPAARRQIAQLAARATAIPDPSLRAKALHGLRAKGYHIAGACVYAAFLRGPARERYVKIIAPLETIYDFLDTLGDARPAPGEAESRALHAALADALAPHAQPHAYFSQSVSTDGGFLRSLVCDVRDAARGIAGVSQLTGHFTHAAKLYEETQTLKHLPERDRVRASEAAFAGTAMQSRVRWYEYAAGAGSQFHVYAPLFLLLGGSSPAAALAAYDAYFPEIAAIHVLLDAFIDQAEDRQQGELNWLDCYDGFDDFQERFAVLLGRAAEKLRALDLPAAHSFTLRLMLTFYLTHPKVWQQNLQSGARSLLRIAAVKTI